MKKTPAGALPVPDEDTRALVLQLVADALSREYASYVDRTAPQAGSADDRACSPENGPDVWRNGDEPQVDASRPSRGNGGTPTAHAVERFMTAHEVADLLDVTDDWVYNQAVKWERTAGMRGLPSYKIAGTRRFRWSEIESALTAARSARTQREH